MKITKTLNTNTVQGYSPDQHYPCMSNLSVVQPARMGWVDIILILLPLLIRAYCSASIIEKALPQQKGNTYSRPQYIECNSEKEKDRCHQNQVLLSLLQLKIPQSRIRPLDSIIHGVLMRLGFLQHLSILVNRSGNMRYTFQFLRKQCLGSSQRLGNRSGFVRRRGGLLFPRGCLDRT